MKEQFTIRLQFKGQYHGQCSYFPSKQKSTIRINLTSFDEGQHQNHNHETIPCPTHRLIDVIIEGITYTLTHELIHHFTNILALEHVKSKPAERIVYYMIGNGGNEWFNEFFKIPEDKEWMKIIEGHIN